MNAKLQILGIRHHSPACARLVEARLREWRPQLLLIEGPSDFNPRIGELLDPAHRAPIAIFSYYGTAAGTRHTFAPFADYSPEWVALQLAGRMGIPVSFIDLPYWHEGSRGRAQVYGEHLANERYAARERLLAQRLGIEGTDALWDHLFEQELPLEQLAERLDRYFDELRGDEAGDYSDQARESYMGQWLTQAMAQEQRVLLICGGWHQLPLKRAAMARLLAGENQNLQLQPVESITRHGSFLIPYSDRRLEAYGGYRAGMPSPGFYRWLYQHGAAAAAERAFAAIVQRLRQTRHSLSTAHLISAMTRMLGLAQLRGHVQPMRVDLLDGLLDGLSQEALSAPPPWAARDRLSMRDHPSLREALVALTGEQVGQLAPGTPLPPLVHEVEALLERQQLDGNRSLSLDRRDAAQLPRSHSLWRLLILKLSGVMHRGNSAPNAARQLSADQHWLENWQLSANEARQTELIEAGAYGPTLDAAAMRVLSEQLAEANTVDALAELYLTAIRAGYSSLGAQLLPDLRQALAHCSDHGALGRAGKRLLGMLGETAAQALLQPILVALLDRLLWLLEALSGPSATAQAADVEALDLVDQLLRHADELALEASLTLAVIARCAANPELPPALRGGSFAILWRHPDPQLPDPEPLLLSAARGYARGEQLGDFLFGLFALARNECVRSLTLLRALDETVSSMSHDEFLIAAPALRQAFHYFPPRERAAIGRQIHQLHGAEGGLDADWMRLPASLDSLARAARLNQAVDALKARFGL